MKKLLNIKSCLAFLLGIAFFALIFPYNHLNDMYIGIVHTAICIIINAQSSLLFAIIFYKVICKSFAKDDFSMYLCYLIILGIAHALFAMMNWGSWLCLGISVVIVIWMAVVWIQSARRNEHDNT